MKKNPDLSIYVTLQLHFNVLFPHLSFESKILQQQLNLTWLWQSETNWYCLMCLSDFSSDISDSSDLLKTQAKPWSDWFFGQNYLR